MHEFAPATITEVIKLLKKAPGKSCRLDAAPSAFVKLNAHLLAHPLTLLINASFSSGIFPACFKFAHVTPVLKKLSLNRAEPGNYRPVSNLSFISKLTEKAVAIRLCKQISAQNSLSQFQSAYRRGHSTETALLRITSDIAAALDTGHLVVLVATDVSAAFETINHRLLLKRLSAIGIHGKALA